MDDARTDNRNCGSLTDRRRLHYQRHSPSPFNMASPNSLPPGVDLSAALSSYLSSKPRPRVETFADASQAGELAGPDGRNMRRIYCPREGCGCLILRAGDAQWKEGVKGVVRPRRLARQVEALLTKASS